MRSSKSRSRNKNNRNRNNNLGNVVNRVFDSSGPEGKVRGTPQQIIDKYNQLARDATLSNDRVAAENFQQHAEHYLRMLGEAQKEQDARREQQERENRERQAQRDRERSDRDSHPQPVAAQPDLADAPQPDVLAVADAADSGLVETPEAQSSAPAEPEAKPSKPRSRAPRKPRKPKEDPAAAPAPAAETPDPAE